MKPLQLEKPHGFLIWKGKQKAIASDKPLPYNEKLGLVCGKEIYGEVILTQPAVVSISEFDRLSEEHLTKPQERKLWWPEAKELYIHRFHNLKLYDDMLPCEVDEDNVEIKGFPKLTQEEKSFINKANDLPASLILIEDAVTIKGNKVSINGNIPNEIIQPILKSVYDEDFEIEEDIKGSNLPVYQLCLVRVPRLWYNKKSKEDAPNYRESEIDNTCANCTFNIDGVCQLYEFEWGEGYVCDSWQGSEETEIGETKQEDDTTEDIMPYKIVENDDSVCVVNTETSEVQECYEFGGDVTKEEAMAKAEELLAALRINVEEGEESNEEEKAITDEDKRVIKSEVRDLNMTDLTASHRRLHQMAAQGNLLTGFSKSDMNWFNTVLEEELQRRAKEEEREIPKPSPLEWGTVKESEGEIQDKHFPKRLEEIRDRENKKEDGLSVNLEEITEPIYQEKEGRRLKQNWVKRLKEMIDMFKEMISWAEYKDENKSFFNGQSLGVKQVNGEYWFFTLSSNAFEDRDGEIITTKALKTYVKENETNPHKGYFNLWHIDVNNKGISDFAKKEYQVVIGRFLLEAGPFLKNRKGQNALEFFKKYPQSHPVLAPEGWGASIEYRYLPEERIENKVYNWIWITRTSVLAKAAAANIHTKGAMIMDGKELTQEQVAAGKEVFKDEFDGMVKEIESMTEELEKDIKFKEKEAEDEEPAEEDTQEEEVEEQETEEGVTEEEQVDTTPAEELVTAVAEKLLAELKPDLEIIRNLVPKVEAIEQWQKTFEKKAEVDNKTQRSRFSLFTQKATRASESEETVVEDNDETIKTEGPKSEKTRKGKKGAAAYFGS